MDLLLMSNVKIPAYPAYRQAGAGRQISKEIQSSNAKSPQPPFAKGGQGGIID